MTENSSEAPQKRRSIFADLSIPQVLAGALSAITVALILTQLGFSGTLIGAGVGSIMGALGTTAYSQSLNKSAELVKKKIPRPVEGRLTAAHSAERNSSEHLTAVMPTTVLERETAATAEDAEGTPTSYFPPAVAVTPEEPEREPKPPLNWKSIALLAVISMTVALAFLSFFEVRMLSENRADGVIVQRVVVPAEEPTKEVIVEREVVIVETPAPQDNSDSDSGTDGRSSGNQQSVPTQQEQEAPATTDGPNAESEQGSPNQEQIPVAPSEPQAPAVPEEAKPNPAPTPTTPPTEDIGTGEQPVPPVPPESGDVGSGGTDDGAKSGTEKTAVRTVNASSQRQVDLAP